MPKLTDEKMKQIVNLLDRSNHAINTLERANSNRMIFPELKSELQRLSDELKSRHSASLSIGKDDG